MQRPFPRSAFNLLRRPPWPALLDLRVTNAHQQNPGPGQILPKLPRQLHAADWPQRAAHDREIWRQGPHLGQGDGRSATPAGR